MLEAALAAGIASAGGDVLLGGVLPTPAAPLLIDRFGFDLAAVISASHNPFEDNGIKFFGADCFKLSDPTELAIEQRLEAAVSGAPERIGSIRELHGTTEDYLRALQERFAGLSLDGVDVVLDCANGSTYRAAPEIFRRLGATVTVLADDARRAQHQRRLRLDPPRRRRRRDARRRPRRRLRLRRRRRSRARGRPHRRARRRRRARRAGDAAPARAGPPAGRRRRRHRDDELRLPHGDASRRRRGGDDRRRRSLRARGAARARAGASAASSPGTSSTWRSSRRATGSRRRC